MCSGRWRCVWSPASASSVNQQYAQIFAGGRIGRPVRRMMPMGSSSSRTRGKLVIVNPSHVAGTCFTKQSACHAPLRATWRPATCNVRGGGAEWLVRHVQRCVRLTLGLEGGEARARLGAAAARDLPAVVQGLQRLGGERDDMGGGRGRAGQDGVDAAAPRARLQLGDRSEERRVGKE